jgi:hypothetical protein
MGLSATGRKRLSHGCAYGAVKGPYDPADREAIRGFRSWVQTARPRWPDGAFCHWAQAAQALMRLLPGKRPGALIAGLARLIASRDCRS